MSSKKNILVSVKSDKSPKCFSTNKSNSTYLKISSNKDSDAALIKCDKYKSDNRAIVQSEKTGSTQLPLTNSSVPSWPSAHIHQSPTQVPSGRKKSRPRATTAAIRTDPQIQMEDDSEDALSLHGDSDSISHLEKEMSATVYMPPGVNNTAKQKKRPRSPPKTTSSSPESNSLPKKPVRPRSVAKKMKTSPETDLVMKRSKKGDTRPPPSTQRQKTTTTTHELRSTNKQTSVLVQPPSAKPVETIKIPTAPFMGNSKVGGRSSRLTTDTTTTTSIGLYKEKPDHGFKPTPLASIEKGELVNEGKTPTHAAKRNMLPISELKEKTSSPVLVPTVREDSNTNTKMSRPVAAIVPLISQKKRRRSPSSTSTSSSSSSRSTCSETSDDGQFKEQTEPSFVAKSVQGLATPAVISGNKTRRGRSSSTSSSSSTSTSSLSQNSRSDSRSSSRSSSRNEGEDQYQYTSTKTPDFSSVQVTKTPSHTKATTTTKPAVNRKSRSRTPVNTSNNVSQVYSGAVNDTQPSCHRRLTQLITKETEKCPPPATKVSLHIKEGKFGLAALSKDVYQDIKPARRVTFIKPEYRTPRLQITDLGVTTDQSTDLPHFPKVKRRVSLIPQENTVCIRPPTTEAVRCYEASDPIKEIDNESHCSEDGFSVSVPKIRYCFRSEIKKHLTKVDSDRVLAVHALVEDDVCYGFAAACGDSYCEGSGNPYDLQSKGMFLETSSYAPSNDIRRVLGRINWRRSDVTPNTIIRFAVDNAESPMVLCCDFEILWSSGFLNEICRLERFSVAELSATGGREVCGLCRTKSEQMPQYVSRSLEKGPAFFCRMHARLFRYSRQLLLYLPTLVSLNTNGEHIWLSTLNWPYFEEGFSPRPWIPLICRRLTRRVNLPPRDHFCYAKHLCSIAYEERLVWKNHGHLDPMTVVTVLQNMRAMFRRESLCSPTEVMPPPFSFRTRHGVYNLGNRAHSTNSSLRRQSWFLPDNTRSAAWRESRSDDRRRNRQLNRTLPKEESLSPERANPPHRHRDQQLYRTLPREESLSPDRVNSPHRHRNRQLNRTLPREGSLSPEHANSPYNRTTMKRQKSCPPTSRF